ncbi:MAG TPA: WecB/TagA/CpsF family glycosyltransferase [Candidatus Dormibacteraeota bacterium]|jgi:N-acetylglucosaminyldiphosphoundecaprenol N-acetyl-beta-D-mannosaminyltransferase|nr:WecB/TagA/CpsF family glycosyltransferase [Candidatus Dormibacteraeota bacterium]
MDAAIDMVVAAVEAARAGRGSPALVVTLNPEILMRARADAELMRIIAGAALIVPDGVGLVRTLRRRGHPDAQRVTGVDLIVGYAPRAAALGHRVAMVGGAPGAAAEAARILESRVSGLQIVITDSGGPDRATAERLAASGCEVVLAAYGGGRQEPFLAAHLATSGAALGIGVGGAFDFLSGRVRRAPRMLQRAGLEWAWRLLRQPWRWRRQLALPGFWWLARREESRARR